MSQLHLLQNDSWQVGILPEVGGSVAFGRIHRDGRWLDFMRPTADLAAYDTSACASYTLVPWSNRIRGGLLRFRGSEYRLRMNSADGTAIHGTAKEFPWTIESADTTYIDLSFDSSKFYGVNCPFRFSARVEFRLDGPRFSTTTHAKNEDQKAMPAGMGHHPYFMRSLASPTDTVQLEIPCSRYFELEKALPSAAPVPIVPRVDFQKLRPLGEVFIDDCLTGRTADKPIRFVYGTSGAQIAMNGDAIFQNIVVYVPLQKPYFAVEPVTNANDGFNLYDKGIDGSGVFVLEPGQEKQGVYSLTVTG